MGFSVSRGAKIPMPSADVTLTRRILEVDKARSFSLTISRHKIAQSQQKVLA